ncbi:hypothetical protein [Aphanothece sacrum]|uniref:Shikimate dehydrogenase n=1 Tax=Aphanothece sacrum FPU1 TaxID=1920663 RepID=A0A401IFT0_APHSA|nr:hypothetical protein [Aphanothece sacrum]GBF80076.1 shikimate dehydrogenase [Aphanothece sacrum FPU1]GBF84620.1 shikimate dehydrogenase [Aphanothece sacrum FPU3]
MSNTPIQVTTDLSQVLGQINNKLDKIDARLNNLEVGQARLEEKVESLDKQLTIINKNVDKIELEQKSLTTDIADLKGAKSLIIPIVVAVLTSLMTLLIRAIPSP